MMVDLTKYVPINMTADELVESAQHFITTINTLLDGGMPIDHVVMGMTWALGNFLADRGVVLDPKMPLELALPPLVEAYRTSRKKKES